MATALVIIDLQNDFTPPDGALAVEGGQALGPLLNEEAGEETYAAVVATRDWHPADHASFEPQGGPWPVHCVAGTGGAELHPSLDEGRVDLVFDKGQSDASGGYSAFESGELAEWLRERDVDRLRIAGLATDVCVRHSALDALEAGFDVEVIADAVRGVSAQDSEQALAEIERAGGRLGESVVSRRGRGEGSG